MKISEYSIRNYQFTLIMVLMVVAVGVATIFQMPRSEDPELNAPIFPVAVIYPGTSPKDMEELVVKPLEKQIYGLDDIKRIKTSINDGLAVDKGLPCQTDRWPVCCRADGEAAVAIERCRFADQCLRFSV